MKSLVYLADIFEKLNGFNLKLQGEGTNIIQLLDNLIAFYSKLQNWRQKVMQKKSPCLKICPVLLGKIKNSMNF